MKHYMHDVVRTLSARAVGAIMGVALTFACGDTSMLTKLRFVGNVAPGEVRMGKLYSEDLDATIGFAAEGVASLGTEGTMPDLSGAIAWINSPPLSKKSLRGKVVLVDIWTYSCINSLRQLPYLKAWAAKYRDQGLVVIGVHTPEFEFEKVRGNVANASRELNITYPIAIDSNRAVWDAFNNQYWPADYIVDAKGQIRYHHFGEGDYDISERVIQELLKEKGATGLGVDPLSISADGIERPPSRDVQSPETYLGYRRAERFQSPGRVAHDSPKFYTEPAELSLNQWGLGGAWDVGPENVALQMSPGKIEFRFHSRDIHLVLAPAKGGKPIRFKVRLDGVAPGNDRGTDTNPDGSGEVREPRLYQLIRQKSQHVQDRTLEIEFLDPGVHAFSFTFG